MIHVHVDYHPIQVGGVETLQVTSCSWNWDKNRPDRTPGLYELWTVDCSVGKLVLSELTDVSLKCWLQRAASCPVILACTLYCGFNCG